MMQIGQDIPRPFCRFIGGRLNLQEVVKIEMSIADLEPREYFYPLEYNAKETLPSGAVFIVV